jgi:hypothetical protein
MAVGQDGDGKVLVPSRAVQRPHRKDKAGVALLERKEGVARTW